MTAAYFILYVGMQWVFGSLNWSFNTHTLKRRAEIKPILMLQVVVLLLSPALVGNVSFKCAFFTSYNALCFVF